MMASKSRSEPRLQLGRIRLAGLVGAFAAALVLLLVGEPPRRALFDAWQRLAPRDLSDTRVHIVAIDDESLREIGPWPWPRYHLARLTEEIGARGAVAIGFDMVFPERDSLSPGIFAGMYGDALGEADRARITALPSWDSVFGSVIGEQPVVLARIGVTGGGTAAGQLAAEAVFSGTAPADAAAYSQARTNIPELDDAARGYGLLNGPPEEDGVVRRVPLVSLLGRDPAPGLGLEVARVALGKEDVTLTSGSLRVGTRTAPIDSEGRMLLRFGDLPSSATTSAVDLLRKGVANNAFAGRAVLIGLTAQGTPDIVSTPLAAETYGVYVQSQAVDALLRGSGWLTRPGWIGALEWLVAALGALLAALLLPRGKRAWFVIPGAGMAIMGLSWIAFIQGALLFDPLPGLALGGGAAAGVGLGIFAQARRERERLRDQLVEERVAAAATGAELEAARAIQVGMLPPRALLSKLDPRLELDALLEPARSVGGDFYDAVRLSADRVAFTVADVTGKGVPASLFMAVSKALSKSMLLREHDLAKVASMLNKELSRDNADSGVTMLLGVIDLETGQVAIVNAGHENPIRLLVDGTTEDLQLEGGPPFCIVDYPWPVEAIRLRAGEALVLITDGVTEAQDLRGAFFGREQAITAISRGASSATDIVQNLLRSVRHFENGAEPSDDLTVMALRYIG